MRILAMGAHPDDLEIFCYGLLAACKDRGDELHLAVATDGAAGAVAGEDNTLAERRAALRSGCSMAGGFSTRCAD